MLYGCTGAYGCIGGLEVPFPPHAAPAREPARATIVRCCHMGLQEGWWGGGRRGVCATEVAGECGPGDGVKNREEFRSRT